MRELEKDLEEEKFNCLQVERDKSSSDEKLSSHIVKVSTMQIFTMTAMMVMMMVVLMIVMVAVLIMVMVVLILTHQY